MVGKQRDGRGDPGPETKSIGKERRWGTIVIAAAVVAVLGAFVAVVAVDLGRGGGGPPAGVEDFEVEQGHTPNAVDYEQSPPVGGEHNPIWQNAAFYEEPLRNENAVHILEHGAVWLAYSPDLPREDMDALREAVEGQDCLMASPYPDFPQGTPVVASAWGKQLGVEDAHDPKLQDFIRSFRRGLQTPEPGAACTGGTAEAAR